MEFIEKDPNHIVIAIPSKGRLHQLVVTFLKEKGYIVDPPSCKGRQLQAKFSGHEHIMAVFVHPKDIPIFLEKKIIDIGFTGMDLIEETNVKIRPVVKLGVGYVRMSILVPEDSDISHPFHLMNQTIGSSFPNITAAYFESLKIPVKIHPILGASEGLPYLGIVNGIVDVVETGKSARANKLKIIDDTIFESECICAVHKPEFFANYRLVNDFLRRIYT